MSKTLSYITVEQFYAQHGRALQLKLAGGEQGLLRKIREATVNRPGLALAGFFKYFAEKRVQVIGRAENRYLKTFSPRTQREKVESMFSKKIPCVIYARHISPSPLVLEIANAKKVPVFKSPLVTMKLINTATILLEEDFAPKKSELGSMIEISGVGVMIRGKSGVGKSECVMALIERGYSLIADDVTHMRCEDGRELIASCPAVTRNHIEVRGLGIINVASVFGIGSIRDEKRLDLVVSLVDWNEVGELDRIGLETEYYEILGIKVRHVTISVKPGRDIARLVEVAALDSKLKSMGCNSAQEFNNRLIAQMQTKEN
ncbi:MAG: HPr(Ser) kinase/phosphatase [Verrucomicrobiota bacterium]|nr:HPr(Ser) kinase/phosphatase [Verrucomicrobiota bacterium]